MARSLAYVGIWVMLFLFFTGFVGSYAIKYYRLQSRGQRTEGIVIGKEQHAQIKYSFSDGKQEYTELGRVGLGTPPFETISLGQRLPVYYLPESPHTSCLGDPKELLRNELPGLVVVPFLFSTFIVIAIERRRHAKKVNGGRTKFDTNS